MKMNLNQSCKLFFAALFAAQHFLAVAQTTNALAPADYPKFIADRNIFDPDREPNVPYVPRPRQVYNTPPIVRQPDSFSLVGIIGYGEGQMPGVHAFFNGTSLEYQKAAQLGDSIATFKVAGIAADSVTLVSGTNTMVLEIGEQLHDDGNGHWVFANGTTVRYNNAGGYGYRRNSGRGGFGGRRRNFNNGNFGNGNYNAGNFNRFRNNFAATAGASDNSQTADQGMNSQNDNAAPDDNAGQDNMAPDDNNAQDNNMAPDDNNAQDNNMAGQDDNNAPDAGTQDNTPASETDGSPAPSAGPTDSNMTLQELQQQRVAELQQIGH
jgi:hypothetical protein